MSRMLRYILLFGLVGMIFVLTATPTSASTSMRVAFDSNILIFHEQVVFAQGTGSLTVLDLKTGEVRLRKKPNKGLDYHGTLVQSPHGVLMIGYDRIMLLDNKTFDPLWQAEACYDAVADEEYVISHDGYHTVSCRNIQTGELCWKAEMEGGWKFLTAKEKIVVFTPDVWDGQSALQVFDFKSGHRLLRHQAVPDTHWLQVYFDGELVYTVDQVAESSSVKPKPRHLTALNLEGEIVAEIDCKASEITPQLDDWWNGRFFWRGKFFNHDGHVRLAYDHEQESLVEFSRRKDCFRESLPSGVLVSFVEKDASGEAGQVFQMIMPQSSWKVYAPHLGETGHVYHVDESHGRILLGSSEGHLECLDLKTGRPQWIYVFPVIRRTMSFSTPYGLPPYLTQQAANYQHGAAKMDLLCGSIPLQEAFVAASTKWTDLQKSSNYVARIAVDPSPDDPFPDLWRYLAWLAFYTLLPLIAVPLFFLIRRGRSDQTNQVAQASGRQGPGLASLGIWCLVLSVSPALGLLEYGRVSCPWTLALKVVFALMILCSICVTVQLYRRMQWFKASVLAMILIGWVYLMRYPWWFA